MNNFLLIDGNEFFLPLVSVIVWRQVFKLTKIEQLVIFYLYWLNKSSREISNDLFLTEGRVSQIHSAALLKLKHSGMLCPLQYA